MNSGGKALILLAATALAGCTSGKDQVQVRPIADPMAKFRQGSADIAAARGQLALGNVGLALEAFRIIQRNRPTDSAAPAGIAECYAQMGRFDLAESNFEAALALAPHDPKLLLGLASIFEREGDPVRALAVRAEAAAAQTAPPPAIASAVPQPKPMPATPAAPRFAHVGSITVELPKARPAERLAVDASTARSRLAQVAQTAPIAAPVPGPTVPAQAALSMPLRSTITVALPAARPAAEILTGSGAAQLQLAQAAVTMPIEPVEPAVVVPQPPLLHAAIVEPVQPDPHGPLKSTITVALPPARPAARIASDSAAGSELAQAATKIPLQLAAPPAPPPEPRPTPLKSEDMSATFAEATGPRIERVSPGEVMLVMTGRPLWRPQVPSRALASTKVQWIPLGNAAVRPNVQVLNAARREGIARSARAVLVDRGWRRIVVADAPQVREKSVVLYPRNRPALGRSLAAQFGVTAQASDVEFPLLLLGRDAPGLVRSQRKS